MTPLEEMGKFKVVVVDPPWPLPAVGWAKSPNNNFDRELPYGTMSLEDIQSLSVRSCMEKDSILFLWTINRYVRTSFSVLDSWGVHFSYMMTWIKPQGFQYPNGPMFNQEHILVGTIGSPKFLDTRAFKLGNFWRRGAHSEKPHEFYDLLNRVTEGPRLDVFGRRRIPGFTSWGDQAPDGPPPPECYQRVLDLQ